MFFSTSVSEGDGFGIFSAAHLLILAGIVLLCAFCARWFRRQEAARQDRVSRTLGGVLLLLECLRVTVYCATGFMTVGQLPLHLCGMALYLCVIHSRFPARWIGQVLYALCLPGACAALLFPDWSRYPLARFITCNSFAIHTCIVLYIILQVSSGRVRPRLSAFWQPVLFLCAVVPPVLLFDRHFQTNFMFLRQPSAGSPLVLLYELAGGSYVGYLVLYAALIFVLILAMLLPFARKKSRGA